MDTINLRYKKRTFKTCIFMGLGFLALGLLGTVFDSISISNYIIAALYLFAAYYYSNYPMIEISESEIKENWWFGKRIALQDIRQIKYFAGDYLIKSQTKELGICKSQLNIEDQQLLTDFLRQYEGKWVNAMPFVESQTE